VMPLSTNGDGWTAGGIGGFNSWHLLEAALQGQVSNEFFHGIAFGLLRRPVVFPSLRAERFCDCKLW